MFFLSQLHKHNFLNLVKLSNLHPQDVERKSLFYVIAGNSDLFSKKNSIYNFNNNSLIFISFDLIEADFSSSSKALIRLSLNLFNGYSDEFTNPFYLFYPLGNQNYILAINAIFIRFGNLYSLSQE
jgi:hypothetical protein